jgi:hypothetical protein
MQLLLLFMSFFVFRKKEGKGSNALLEKRGLVEFDSDGLFWKFSTS